MDIERTTHVIYNPDTELWEVWQLTPTEAFNLDQDYYGAGVAIENMNHDDQSDEKDQPCTP